MVCGMLTDEQWDLIKGMFPSPVGRGRPQRDLRIVLEGILRVVRIDIPCWDLPSEFPPWQTVYHHFNRWSKSGLLMKILRRSREIAIDLGEVDVTRWHMDSAVMRASKAAAGAEKREPEEPSDYGLRRSQEHFLLRDSLLV